MLQFPLPAHDLGLHGAPLGPLGRVRKGRIGPPTALAPGVELLDKQGLAPTVHARRQLIECGGLHHHGVLISLMSVAGGELLPRGRRAWPCLASLTAEGFARDVGRGCQLRDTTFAGR